MEDTGVRVGVAVVVGAGAGSSVVVVRVGAAVVVFVVAGSSAVEAGAWSMNAALKTSAVADTRKWSRSWSNPSESESCSWNLRRLWSLAAARSLPWSQPGSEP